MKALLVGSVVHLAIHVGIDSARQDGIDAHILRAEFGCERLRQADQAGLAGGIGGNAGEGKAVADEGRREDHRAAAVLDHFGDLVLGGEERSGQVDGERIGQTCLRNLGARAGFAERAGIVEGDVESAVALDGKGDQRLVIVFRAHVAGKRDGFAAFGLDFGDEVVQFRSAAGADDDLCTFGSEELCGGAADAGAGAGDDCDFSIQAFHFSISGRGEDVSVSSPFDERNMAFFYRSD